MFWECLSLIEKHPEPILPKARLEWTGLSRHYSRSMLSDIVVPGTTSHPQSNVQKLFRLLEQAAAQWPGDTALVRGAQTFTFQQLKRAAEQLAAELVNSVIKPGTKVASCVLMGRNT